MIATSTNKVAGESYPARRYTHNGHFVELHGPSHVIAHDATQLEGHGYRIATPQEQEQYMAAKNGTGAIRESAPVALSGESTGPGDENTSEDESFTPELDETEQAIETAPTRGKKRGR
jgi:hypothetical protein